MRGTAWGAEVGAGSWGSPRLPTGPSPPPFTSLGTLPPTPPPTPCLRQLFSHFSPTFHSWHLFKNQDFISLEKFKVHIKIEQNTEISCLPCARTHAQPPPLWASRIRVVRLFTIDDPALPRHRHPEFTVYMKAHSWCCTFYRFR